jgi:hypothetical protein
MRHKHWYAYKTTQDSEGKIIDRGCGCGAWLSNQTEKEKNRWGKVTNRAIKELFGVSKEELITKFNAFIKEYRALQ